MMTHTTDKPLSKFSGAQVLVILLLALTQFTVVLDFMVMSPMGDMLMKSMSLSPKQFGAAVSAYAFSAGISGMLTAGFADRFDRKKLLLFFYIGFIGGTLFCGLAQSYLLLVAARIVTGLFGGVIGSISMAIVADLFPLEKRGRVMGFMQMGFGASQVLGIPFSLFIANKWGWHAPFLMIVGLAALIWLTIALRLQPINKHLALPNDRNALRHLWHTISQRKYRIGFLSMSVLGIGGFMMMPWGAAFSINNLHLSQEQLVPLFMISGIASLIFMPFIGRLSDRVDKYRIFLAASAWMIVMVAIYTNLTPVPLWVAMLMNIGFMAGVIGRMVPASALNSALPELRDRGAFMSVSASLQQMAGGIGAAIGGFVVVQRTKTSPLEHYNTLGHIVIGLSLLSFWLVYRVSETVRQNSALQNPAASIKAAAMAEDQPLAELPV